MAATMAFREGDRVRGIARVHEIAGAVGTVVRVVKVTGDGRTSHDLLVRFDRPVVIAGEPQWTIFRSAHSFEFITEAMEAAGPFRTAITGPPGAVHAALVSANSALLEARDELDKDINDYEESEPEEGETEESD